MTIAMTMLAKPTPDMIAKAAGLLREGGLVAFPTETVYGLGGDASHPLAVARIFAAKGRPADHPLIVHLADAAQLPEWAVSIPEGALRLAKAFWPGPLTLILKKQPWVLGSVTGGQDTIGLRIPRHPVAQALLKAFGRGLAAPSANPFTRVSPTTAGAVLEELGDRVDMVLDGGACEVGLESVIVDMSGEAPVILRPGMISAQAVSEILGCPVSDTPSGVRAPGRHHLHYAPRVPASLVNSCDMGVLAGSLPASDLPTAVVTYSDVVLPLSSAVRQVRLPDDPVQYAHDLYQTLHSLDHQEFKRILIERVPEGPDWDAIRDRLEKAAASPLPTQQNLLQQAKNHD